MKKLLTILILLMAVNIVSRADSEPIKIPLSLTELNDGWDSSYDSNTKTITFTGGWKGRGWWIDSELYSNLCNKVVIQFNAPTNFKVRLEMVYIDANGIEQTITTENENTTDTELSLNIPIDIKSIKKIDLRNYDNNSSESDQLVLIDAFLEAPFLEEGISKTLYNGETELTEWPMIAKRSGSLAPILEVNNQLFVTISAKSGENSKIAFRDNNYGYITDVSIKDVSVFPYVAKIRITDEIASGTSGYSLSNGFHISGEGVTITKVELYKPNVYTLTKSAENGSIAVRQGETNVTSTNTFVEGTELTLTASTDASGYEFDKWTDGTNELAIEGNVTSISGNVLNITMNSNMSVTALFKLQQFAVTAVSENDSKGTVSFSSGSSGNLFDYNSELTLTATPLSGYSFKRWMNGETQVSTNASYTFNVTEAINLIAEFEEKAKDTPEISLSNFSNDEDNSDGVTFNNSTGVLTTTAESKTAQQWIGDNSGVKGNKLVVKFAGAAQGTDQSVKVAVAFVAADYTEVSASPDDNHIAVVDFGDHKDKYIKNIYIQLSKAGSITVKSVALDPLYTVSVSADDAKGTATIETTPTSDGKFAHGTEVTVKAEPKSNTNYTFKEWKKGETSVSTDASYTFTATEDVALTAEFTVAKTTQPLKDATQKMVNETVGTKVLIANSAFTNVSAGDIITVNLSEVAESEAFIVLKENSSGTSLFGSNYSSALTSDQTSFTHTLTNSDLTLLTGSNKALCITGEGFTCNNITITSAGNITADAAHTTMYVLSVTQPAAGGTIQIGGTDAVAQKAYDNGSQVTLTAVRDGGYALSKWTKDGADAGSENPLSVTFNGADVAVTATFVETAPITYPITVWEGSEVVSWSAPQNQPSISADKFANLALNDVIKVYVTNAENATINIMANEGWVKLSETDSYQVTTDEILAKIKSQGIALSGVNYTLTAVKIEKPKYQLTIVSNGGSVTVKKGEETETTADREFEAGTALTLAATPASDIYTFSKWQKNGADIVGETNPTLSAIMDEADMTITAVFTTSVTPQDLGAASTEIKAKTDTQNEQGIVIPCWRFKNASVGDIITINMTVTEAGTITLKQSDNGWGDLDNSAATGKALAVGTTSFTYALTETSLPLVKANGLYVMGDKFTCTSVTLISAGSVPASDARTEKYIYNESKAITTEATATIAKEIFTHASIGDKLTLTVSSVDNATITLKSGEETIKSESGVSATSYSYTLQSSDITKVQANGLTIAGSGFTLDKVHLLTEGEVTEVSDPIPNFSLDNFEADEGNTYDKTNHILTNANAWSGGQLWIGNNSTYSGSTLVVRTSAASKLKIIVGYTDSSSSNAELSDSESSTLHAVSLDSSKKIQKVIIQNKEAGMVTFTEMSLDPSYTLTITQPANGTIKNGESNAVTGTHNYGTELTLTAVPSETYELSKWTDGTNDLVAEADGSLKVTMDGNKSVTAVFGKARTTKDLSTGSTKINGSTSVVIHKEMFANAAVGDVITINISNISTPSGKEYPGYAIKGAGEDETENSGYNWKWIEGGSLANNATSIIRTITSDDLVTLKASGLSIEGDGIYVCGDVTLTTNGEVPEAQTHSNPSFTLTVNEPIGGTIAIKKDSETVSAGAFDIDTELTLTATAANGYTFLKWQKNGEDAGTDATLSITMSANIEITALFQGAPLEYEEKRTLFEGSVDINWSGVAIQPSTVGAILEAGEQLILTTTVAEGAYGQVVIRGADRSDAIEGSAIGGLVNGENVITLTSAMVEAMREKFGFWGADATLTKVVLYKPVTIFSEAGVADLTTMTESEGKSTLAVPHEESLKGNVLVVESTEDATVTVTYTDNTTATNKAGNRNVGTPAASQTLVSLDANKYIAKIEVNKAKSVISKIYTATLPVFEADGDNYAADLAMATADAGVLYDTSSFTIAVSSGWKGISLTSTEGETVKGAEISLTFGSEAKVKTTAYYTDGTDTGETGIMSEAATVQKLAIDNTKTIKSISIQPQEAGAVQLKEIKVNAEVDVQKFTLTLSTPENGTVVIKKGNEEVKAGEFDENTELTLTATAAEGYEFTKWQKNGEDAGTEATLTVKMTADMTIAAVFSKKTEPIIDEKTGETDLTEMTPQDPSTTSVEYNDEDQSITITTTEPYKAAQIWFNEPEKLAKGNVLIVDIAESGVNVTVTVKYTDGTESSMTSTAHAASSRHAAVAGTKISVPLETGKDVQNIEVKNAEAGTITIQKMVVTTKNIFTDGVADLSMAKPQSNAIYDTSTYSLAVTKGWTGITITPLATEQVSGVELMLQFTGAAQVKVAVTYNEGEGPSVIMDEAAKYLQMTLDKTKTVKEIQIQPTTAGVIQLKSLAVNQTETENPDPDYLAPLEYGERRTLFESTEGTQLSWNDICQMAANYGAILEEREQIEVYISARVEGCDWPKVFIKDAAGAECGSVLELNSINQFPYMAKFKLNSAMAEQLSNGFSISGDGIIVTKVCLYKPEALKPGDIDIADLNGGYQSSYDATSKTITTTSRWAARGWDIGDGRYNGYDVIVVEFEAVDFPVTLRMEYVDADGATKTLSQGASAGSSQVAVEIPDNIQQINYVYLMYENPGTLILLNADVLTGTYIQTVKTGGNSQWDDGEAWYRLDGKRVSQPGRGIYIHNGKKIVIK